MEDDTKLLSNRANQDEPETTASLPPSLRDSTNGAPLLTLSGRPNTRRASGPLLDTLTVKEQNPRQVMSPNSTFLALEGDGSSSLSASEERPDLILHSLSTLMSKSECCDRSTKRFQ